MRWFVEISSIGLKPGPTTTLCLEAAQWQPALQKARALRGDDGPLSNFSIELLEDGFRAIDPATRTRYVVKRAPDEAALSSGAPAMDAAEGALKKPSGASVAASGQASAAPAELAVQASSPQPAEAPPAPMPRRPLAQTMVYGSSGTASVIESNRAPAFLKEDAPAPGRVAPTIPDNPTAAAPSIASIPRPPAPLPSFQVLSKREENPTERSPLSYREIVYAVVPGTSEEDARRLILERFEHVRGSVEDARPGKLINLAIFDHMFQGRPLRRPMVTLSWKDWKNEAPEIQYPLRDKPAGSPSSPPGPASRPPPRASSSPPASAAVASPARSGAAEASAVSPVSEALLAPSSPPGPTLPSAPSAPAPSIAAPVVVVAASPAASPALSAREAAAPAKVLSAAPAPSPIRAPAPSPVVPAFDAGTGVPPTAPVPTKVAAGVSIPFALAPAPAKAPSSPPAAPAPAKASSSPPAAPDDLKRPAASEAPVATPAAAKLSRPKKRLSGEDLLAELFEAFGDLHFLRDSLEGAEFVLGLTLEKLPSEVGLVSLFDINKREFVVVRQAGGPRSALCQRQPERAPTPNAAMRKRHAVVLSDPEGVARASDDRWKTIGVDLKSLVCAPVELGGRYLGLIELANPLDGGVFNEGDGNALTYIGQQFAEFVATHGIALDPELIRERAAPTPAARWGR